MQTLANISDFENLCGNALCGRISDMSVFNKYHVEDQNVDNKKRRLRVKQNGAIRSLGTLMIYYLVDNDIRENEPCYIVVHEKPDRPPVESGEHDNKKDAIDLLQQVIHQPEITEGWDELRTRLNDDDSDDWDAEEEFDEDDAEYNAIDALYYSDDEIPDDE